MQMWSEEFRDPTTVAAEQILIASVLAFSQKLYERDGAFYYVESYHPTTAEYLNWKCRYWRLWNCILDIEKGIMLKIPEDVCERIDCARIARGDTAHLLNQLTDFGLAVWFMETGQVFKSNDQIFLYLPFDWQAEKEVVDELCKRFDAKPVTDKPGANLAINNVQAFRDVVYPHIIPAQRFRFSHLGLEMHDVSATSISSVGIQKVGIRQVPVPLNIHLRSEVQPTIAKASIYTSLSPSTMGSHLSRLMEILNSVSSVDAVSTDQFTIESYLKVLKERLSSEDAFLKLRFPILLIQKAPVTGSEGYVRYECTLSGELVNGELKVTKTIRVPYISACICSKSISLYNAHCQRSFADVSVVLNQDADITFEELIELVEASCSAPIRACLKREDEKWVVETSYDNAGFVETISRNIATKLATLPVKGWLVVCEHEESIHQHNAVALIRGGEYIP